MKKILMIMVAAASMSMTASAAYIDISFVGISSSADIVTGFTDGSTSLSFSLLGPFDANCSGLDAGLCGATASLSASLDSSIPGQTVNFIGGLVYTITTPWAVVGPPSSVFPGLATSGTFSFAGYDDTPGRLVFTFTDANGDGTGNFSANGFSSPVPEPGSLALLGSGLVGLGFLARRRKSKN